MQLLGLSIAIIAVAMLVAIALLSRHKKSFIRNSMVVGANAVTISPLSPEGSVLINGEVWRARSRNMTRIDKDKEVRIIAVHQHLLMVESKNF